MKHATFLSVIGIAAVVFSLSSCAPMGPMGMGYEDGPPPYSETRVVHETNYYNDGYSSPAYYSRPYSGYSGSYYSSYGGGYGYGSGYCSICRSNTCRGHSEHGSTRYYGRHDNDHDDHHSSSNSSHSSGGQTLYRHVGGSSGAAQGTHTKEWFVSHGYAPTRLQPASSGNSNNKKKDDDDHKKHHH